MLTKKTQPFLQGTISDKSVTYFDESRNKKLIFLTFCKAMPISFCISCGVLNNKISDVSFTNGSTDTNINMAMNTEHIGSATFKPKFSMRNVEIMTPILPNVSAKTCRNTPRNVKEKYMKSARDRHKYIDY